MKKRILSMVLALSVGVGTVPTTAMGFELQGASVYETETETAALAPLVPQEKTVPVLEELAALDADLQSASYQFKGTGKSYDPFLIENPTDLERLSTLVNGKENDSVYNTTSVYYRLEDDVVANGSMKPIGKAVAPFYGKFDGNYHTITVSSGFTQNTVYDADAPDDLGMFGYIGTTGIVKNLTVTGTIKFDLTSAAQKIDTTIYVGGIAGVNAGRIENCISNANVTGDVAVTYSESTTYVGTYTNSSNSNLTKIIYTYNDFNHSATVSSGGIVGRNLSTGTVINSVNNGPVAAQTTSAMSSDSNKTTVTGYDNGVSGYSTTGNSTATSIAGGIAGENGGTVINCYNTGGGTVYANSTQTKAPSNSLTGATVNYSGGLVGKNSTTESSTTKTGSLSLGYSTGATTALGKATTTDTDPATSAPSSNTIPDKVDKNGNSVSPKETSTSYLGGVVGSGSYTNAYWMAHTASAITDPPDPVAAASYATLSKSGGSFEDVISSNGYIDDASRNTTLLGSLQTAVNESTRSKTETLYSDDKGTVLGSYSDCYELYQWDGDSFTTTSPSFNPRINTKITGTGDGTVKPYLSTDDKKMETTHATSNTDTVYLDIAPDDDSTVKAVYIMETGNYDVSEKTPVELAQPVVDNLYSFEMGDNSVIIEVEFESLGGHDCADHTGWTKITTQQDLMGMEDGGKYYVAAAASDKTLQIAQNLNITNKTVDLCLNGCTIESSVTGAVITVGEGGTLNLYDGATNSGVITHKVNVTGSGITVSGSNSVLNMKGGTISGNTTRGVNVASGTFNMTGGVVKDNTVATGSNGPNVYVDTDGIMTISGKPVIAQEGSDGLSLAKGSFVTINGELDAAASIYITTNSGNNNKIAVPAEGVDISTYAKHFTGATNVFYRTSQDAIYLAKVEPIPDDYKVTFKDTVLTTTGTDPYKIETIYDGTAHGLTIVTKDSLTNTSTDTATMAYEFVNTLTNETIDAAPTNAGVYEVYVTITDSDYFTNKRVKVADYTINRLKLVDGQYTITVDGVEYPSTYTATYDGSEQKPEVKVSVNAGVVNSTANAVPLVLDTDFTVAYSNNVNISTAAKIALTGKTTSNFEFAREVTFTIAQAPTDLTLVNSLELEGKDFMYSENMKVTVLPMMGNNKVTLADSTKYDVTLYVVTDEGNVKLADLTTFDSLSGTYTGTYSTKDKKLTVGPNDLVVIFTAKPNLDGSSNAGNMGQGEVPFTMNLTPKSLMASVVPDQWREYNSLKTFTAELDLNSSDHAINNPEAGDDVTALAYGFIGSDVAGFYNLILDNESIDLDGEHEDYYTLAPASVDTSDKVEIRVKNLATIEKNHTVTVMKGVGTYAEPALTYEVDGEIVTIPGAMTYTDSTYDSYDKIVAHLKTLDVNDVLTVPYSFTPSNPENYEGTAITGKITFIVVKIQFTGINDAIVVKEEAIYGDVNNFFYDPSKFVANVGTSTTTGAYFLTVTDSLGGKVTDLSLMKVGEYNYSVSFTSYDSAYVNEEVTTGTFQINPRPVEVEWDAVTFEYDSTEKLPTGSITNIVWVDDVSLAVTGSQKNLGSYTAMVELAGVDRLNYTLAAPTVTFSITPATAKGLVTVTSNDADGNGVLSAGDVLTADVSTVSPVGGTVFYHWYRDDVLMSSAVYPTYTVSTSDIADTKIHCQVTFSGNTEGTLKTLPMVVGDTYFNATVNITYAEGVLTANVSDENTNNYTIYWTGVANSSTGETYTMDFADFGNNVTATVVANEASGYCGSISGATSVAATKPYNPEIEVTAGAASVEVTWEEVFHGGAEISNYTLTVTDREGKEISGSPFTVASNLTSYTVTGLANNTVYSFKLGAKNSVGTAYSNIVTAVPHEDSETDSEGEITTTTTTTTYVDEDGSTVTETVTVEINTADGSTKTTTVVKTEALDGTITTETFVEQTDKTGTVIETENTYDYLSDDINISYETLVNDETSKGSLVADTTITDVVALPVSLLKPIVETEDSTITIITPNANVSFDNAALDAMFAYANPKADDVLELVAEYTSVEKMPLSVRDRLANAFIMDLTVRLGNMVVSDFEPGSVTVTLPYNRSVSTKTVSVYHVADSGSMTRMNNAAYSTNDKNVTFTATHFSYYAVLEEINRFTDVYTSDYFFDAVQWGVENGITTGSTPTTFNPYAQCTRAEAITLLWKATGSELSSAHIPFEDVTEKDYYYESIRWAYNNGITNGTSPKRYSPFDVCTRDQIVTFLWIANGKPIVDEELYFSDVPVGGWFTEAVRWAVSEGVTAGTTKTTFGPDDVCTRAEIITFLYKCSTL